MKVGDGQLPFASGSCALIPPLIPHQWVYNNSGGKVHYLMVAYEQQFVDLLISTFPEFRNSLEKEALPREALSFTESASLVIRKSLFHMIDASDSERLIEMLRLLLFVYNTQEHVTAGKAIQTQACLRRYQKALEIIMRTYMTNIKLEDIAREVGMTSNAFSTFFHRQAGITFSQYLINYRLNVAANLLRTTKKRISEIVYLCGFRDQPHFCRSFRKAFGVSPINFRNQTSENGVTITSKKLIMNSMHGG